MPQTTYFVLQGNGVRLVRVAPMLVPRGQYRRISKKTGRPMTRVEPHIHADRLLGRPRWVDNRLLFKDEQMAHVAWESARDYARARGTTMIRALEELSREAGPKDYLI